MGCSPFAPLCLDWLLRFAERVSVIMTQGRMCVRESTMTERTVSVKIVAFCASISALIGEQKLNEVQLLDAVNSALGQLKHTGESDASLKLSIKADKDKGDVMKLSEKIVNKFSGPASSPLRLALFNEELAKLEKSVGVISFADWPSYLQGWASKFKLETE
jgi:hypothetical protein